MKYRLTPQEKDTYCVCASLQAIFRRHDLEVSQDDIASQLNPSKKGFYVDDDAIKTFVGRQGFDYESYMHNQVPFGEYDFLVDDIAEHDGFVGFDNHVRLVIGFRDPTLMLLDPLQGERERKDLSDLVQQMQKSAGYFSLLRRRN